MDEDEEKNWKLGEIEDSFPIPKYKDKPLWNSSNMTLRWRLNHGFYNTPTLALWPDWVKRLLYNGHKKNNERYNLWLYLWRNGVEPGYCSEIVLFHMGYDYGAKRDMKELERMAIDFYNPKRADKLLNKAIYIVKYNKVLTYKEEQEISGPKPAFSEKGYWREWANFRKDNPYVMGINPGDKITDRPTKKLRKITWNNTANQWDKTL